MLLLWTNSTSDKLKKQVGRLIKSEELPHRVSDVPDAVWIDPPTPDKKGHYSYPLPACQPGDLVLAMGGDALTALAQNGVVPKNRTITGLRNQLHQLPNGAAA